MQQIHPTMYRRWIIQSLHCAINTVSAVAESDHILDQLVDARRGVLAAERYLVSPSAADASATRLRMNVVDALTELARAKVQVAWALIEADQVSALPDLSERPA